MQELLKHLERTLLEARESIRWCGGDSKDYYQGQIDMVQSIINDVKIRLGVK
jgi:hypothetical protein